MVHKKTVIPDKIFHKLWDYACDSDSFDEFFSMITSQSSKSYVNMQKYNIFADKLYDVLKSIHCAAHYPIKSMIIDYGFTKASFSHRFCVPIRTVENWCAQTNKCPGYTRLLFLNALGYSILPKGFYFESTLPTGHYIRKSSPEKSESCDSINSKEMLKEESNFVNQENDFSHFSLRDWEQTHTNSCNSDILAKTNYLSDILKRRSRQIGDDC